MRLLEKLYYSIKINKVKEAPGYQFLSEVKDYPDLYRPLTVDEQVEYLYEKCLNGSVKEYREILDFVSYFAFAEVEHLNSALAHLDFAPDDIDHQDYMKSHIRKALNTQANEQALNQQEK